MPVTITISEEFAEQAISSLRALSRALTAGDGEKIVEVPDGKGNLVETVVPVEEPAKKGRKKAPAADVVIEQPKPVQTDIEEVTGERLLTIEQVREMTRGWSSAGHMDRIAEEMAARGIKKMSQVDPEAAESGKPSALFGAYADAIEARIAGAAS